MPSRVRPERLTSPQVATAFLAVVGTALLLLALGLALDVPGAVRSRLNHTQLLDLDVLFFVAGTFMVIGVFLLHRLFQESPGESSLDESSSRDLLADLSLLRAVGIALTRGDDLETILHVLVEEAGKAFSCRSATIYRLSKDGEYLELGPRGWWRSRMATIAEIIRRPLPAARVSLATDGWYAHVLRSPTPVVTNDPAVIYAMMAEFEGAEKYERFFPAIARALNMRAVMSAAIRAGETTVGVIDVGRSEPFTERDVERFTAVVGECAGILRQEQLVQALFESEERFRTLSQVDELTGVYNRRGFFLLAEHQLRVAGRLREKATLFYGVFYGDLNGFKAINDTYGHAEGDRMLRETARLLRATFRESDVIGRVGGDEFATLTVETSDAGTAASKSRFLRLLDEWNDENSAPWELAVSLGFARWDPWEPRSLDELLAEADRRMYEGKRSLAPPGL